MSRKMHLEDTAQFEMDACRDVIANILAKPEGMAELPNFYEMYCYNMIPEWINTFALARQVTYFNVSHYGHGTSLLDMLVEGDYLNKTEQDEPTLESVRESCGFRNHDLLELCLKIMKENSSLHGEELTTKFPAKAFNNYYLTKQKLNTWRNNLLVYQCGFATVTMAWVIELVKQMKLFSNKKETDIKVLEICSGIGCLAKALTDCGVNVIPTDSFEDSDIINMKLGNFWLPIQHMDAFEALSKYGEEVDYVLCSWPRPNLELASFVKNLYHINPKAMFIYIGDSVGGCCANDEFFKSVTEIEPDPKCLYNRFYPKWGPYIGINEIIKFYKYNTNI